MSTKALIRKKGKFVECNNQPIEGKLKISRKQKEFIKSNNKEEKEKIEEQIIDLLERFKDNKESNK